MVEGNLNREYVIQTSEVIGIWLNYLISVQTPAADDEITNTICWPFNYLRFKV